MRQGIILLGLASLLLFLGCVQPSGNNSIIQTITLNESTVIREHVWYQIKDQPYQFEVVSFEDSRCPIGVQCVWEGEQAILLHVVRTKPCDYPAYPDVAACSNMDFNVRLSDNRLKQVNFDPAGWTFKVESVNIALRSARIQISLMNQPTPVEESAWFSIAPQQCGQNAWNEWDTKSGWSQTVRFSSAEAMQKALIKAWLESQGISVTDVASRTTAEIVCQACDCPSGQEVAVLVNQKDFATLRKLNFTQLPPAACTMEARACSDGSFVGRSAPWCEFPPCPTPVKLTVNESTIITIVKTNYPGFTREPVTVTFTIDVNGTGHMVTDYSYPSIRELSETPADFNGQFVNVSGWLSQVGCTKMACQPSNPCCNQCFGTLGYSGMPEFIHVNGNSCTLAESNGTVSLGGKWTKQLDGNFALDVNQRNEKVFYVSREKLEAFARMAQDNRFFALTQEQIPACMADGPTKGIAVTIQNNGYESVQQLHNEIMQIGAECDQNASKPVRDLIQEVENWVNAAQ